MKGAVFNILNYFVKTQKDTSKGVWKYGNDNLLPNNNIRLINDCGVAKRCTTTLKRYIEADGFANDALNKVVIGGMTGSKLLSEASGQVSYFGGFAFAIRRSPDGNIGKIEPVNFQGVRKRTGEGYSYNPLLGQPDFKESETTIHPAYFGIQANLAQLESLRTEWKNKPEILYVYDKTSDNPFYPVPDYISGLEDINTCIELSKMDYELTVNGFMPSAVLTTAEMDNTNEDTDTKKTPLGEFHDILKQFTGSIRDSKRKDLDISGRFKMLHIQVAKGEERPELAPFNIEAIVNGSNEKREIISREVCRLFGVHPVLVGFSDAAILGNTQALSNAILTLNNHVNPLQRMIQRGFEQLMIANWTISQFNPINYIPNEVYSVMTEDEKRATAGLQPIEKKVATDAEITSNALNALSPLVANKVLESMTQDEIRALVGLKPSLQPKPVSIPTENKITVSLNGNHK